MKPRSLWCTAAALGVFTVLASGAIAQNGMTPLDIKGPYVQQMSGMIYPESVGDFQRVGVMQYKPDASDVSAGYLRRAPNAEIVATAYTFPIPGRLALTGPALEPVTPQQCGTMAAQIMQQVTTANPSAQRITTDQVTLDQGGPQQGYHAVFTFTAPRFMGRTNEPVKSEAFVFCVRDKWLVEYRFSYPQGAADASAEIAQFMSNLKWTYGTSL
jgi:hypothetical protein